MSTQTTRRATDPIFAAIERVEAANAGLKRIPSDGRPYDAWYAAHRAKFDKWEDAENKMLATVPTTAAGALALLNYFRNSSPIELDPPDILLFDSLVAYLERAAVQS
jgi:hypothetical protein